MSNALITLPEAALATHASPRASSKYLFIPTTDIVSALADEGWVVNSAVQTKSKSGSTGLPASHAALPPR